MQIGCRVAEFVRELAPPPDCIHARKMFKRHMPSGLRFTASDWLHIVQL